MASERDDFYVGYLPMPKGHGRFARAAFLAALFIAACAGAGIAWMMDDPGEAVWESKTATISGTLRFEPVPFLETDAGPVLLVEIGKFGARDLTAFGEGVLISAQGLLLHRGEQRMLEMAAGDDAIISIGDSATRATSTTPVRRVTIVGEIIDTKCYLGAMKPGRGRTHAACARLCIRGGIPAGVVGTVDDQELWAVIDPGEAAVIDEALLNAVGEAVIIEGELVTMNGLAVVRNVALVAGD